MKLKYDGAHEGLLAAQTEPKLVVPWCGCQDLGPRPQKFDC